MRPLKPSLKNNWKMNSFFPFHLGKSNYPAINLLRNLYEIEPISQRISAKFSMGLCFSSATIAKWFFRGALCIALCGRVHEGVHAFELSEDIQLHGFLTQGYFLTSDNRLFGKSDMGGSFDYTEAGLGSSWSLNPDFRIAGQLLFRRAGPRNRNDIELDFGLIDYTLHSTVDSRLGIRLGRFKLPFGFYNETRDVLFTRPTILLPQSIYADATRDVAVSADGGLIYSDFQDEWGNLSFQLGAGFARASNLDTEITLLGADFPGNTYSALSGISQLRYDFKGGQYRMAITSAFADTRYDPEFSPPNDLGAGKIIFKPLIFSLQYNQEKLSLTAEYAIRPLKASGFGGLLDRDHIGESYYLQAEYRFDTNWRAILRHDAFYNNRKDRYGNKFNATTGYPAHTQFAKDWTFGLRYNVNPSFLIAAEYHYINGTVWVLPFQDNPNPFDLKQRWDLFALAVSYRF